MKKTGRGRVRRRVLRRSQSRKCNNTAKAEAGVVPKGTVLWAEKVVDAEVKEAIDEVIEEKRDDGAQVIENLKFDIKLLKDEEEIEPDGTSGIQF